MSSPKLLPAPKKKQSRFPFALPLAHKLLGPAKTFATAGPLHWGALALLVGINMILAANSQLPLWYALIPMYTQPFVAAPHRTLALAFTQEGLPDGAKREQAIVADLIDAPVLGENTANEQAVITQHIAYWQDILATKPDYRDGYLALAHLLYQQGNISEAYEATQKAYTIDPTSEVTQHFLSILTSQLGK